MTTNIIIQCNTTGDSARFATIEDAVEHLRYEYDPRRSYIGAVDDEEHHAAVRDLIIAPLLSLEGAPVGASVEDDFGYMTYTVVEA